MQKTISLATSFTRIASAIALFGLACGHAAAQDLSNQRPATDAQQQMQSAPLPRISTPSLQSRQQFPQSQQSQQLQRPQQFSQFPQTPQNQFTPPLTRQGYVRDVKGNFESYVETVTGAPLEIFGKNLFNDVPTTFAPFDSAQVNGDYVIGTGDELQIRGWGMVDIDVTTTIDRSGTVFIPRVGTVKVAGIKYRDLQGFLKQAVGRIFNNFELTASISQTRALQIYVSGHALRPGTYTVHSMSTMLNALFTSGGPDATGSMRNIQLKRGGQTVATFDMYDLLVNGDKRNDMSLRDGDIIFIPEVGPLVAVTGNVKTPAIFELKGASTLVDAFNWAGGVDSAAEGKQVVVEKSVDNVYKTVAELVVDKSAPQPRLAAIPLLPADIVRVFAPSSVAVESQIRREYVRVSGEVKQSGVFQIKPGETLRELMFRLGGSDEHGYLYATQLKRESVRRAQQEKLNEVADRFERDLENSSSAKLAGVTDKEAITVQEAELARQRRVAQRLRTVKAEGRIVLELVNSNAQVKDLPDLALQDGDSIFVPRKPGTIDVLGSVFQASSFIYKPNRTVKDYLQLAGGTTATAATDDMYVIRADGTAKGRSSGGWFSGVGGTDVNPGDTIVVPETIERSTWRQSIKEWTAIFYQFGLGAAGLKVLKN
jgi:protein involved in polysaccharide export with SLBB domain